MLTYGGKVLKYNNKWIGRFASAVLPPLTVRLLFSNPTYNPVTDYKPRQSSFYENGWRPGSVWTRVSSEPNIWDYYCDYVWEDLSDDPYWKLAFGGQFDSTTSGDTYVLDANFGTVWTVEGAFMDCDIVYSVPLDMPNVRDANFLFCGCTLKECPYIYAPILKVAFALFGSSDTQSREGIYNPFSRIVVPYMPLLEAPDAMFYDCKDVSVGMLDAYNYLSALPNLDIPSEASHLSYRTFTRCGVNNPVGTAALAQIPSNWK